MSNLSETGYTPAASTYWVIYDPEQGSCRQLQFEPRDDNDGWWLIELRHTEADWQVVGREPLTDVWTGIQQTPETPTVGDETSQTSHPLEVFQIVAQKRAWQILQTVSLLEEPVSRTQLRQFIAAFDRGDINGDEPADPDLNETLNERIREMATIDVIEETPNGITSGPQFGAAFETVVVS